MYYLLKMVFAPKKSNSVPPQQNRDHVSKSNQRNATPTKKDIEGDYVDYEEVKE